MKNSFLKLETIIATTVMLFFTFSSCLKKPDPISEQPTTVGQYGTIGFEFSNYAVNKPIILNSDTFTTMLGEKIVPTKFNYYISNIKFTKDDGTEYIEPESYHLVSEETAASKHFHLKDIPVGNYKSITFMIGIDSTRNVSGAQTGALDPGLGMFWTWDTGYIMAKLEGSSPQSNTTDKKFIHHIGGYSGIYKAQRIVTLNFPDSFVLTEGTEGTIRMRADVLKWFSATTNVSVSSVSNIMGANLDSKMIADNLVEMFSVISVSVL